MLLISRKSWAVLAVATAYAAPAHSKPATVSVRIRRMSSSSSLRIVLPTRSDRERDS